LNLKSPALPPAEGKIPRKPTTSFDSYDRYSFSQRSSDERESKKLAAAGENLKSK
jgi:hypothetical protein